MVHGDTERATCARLSSLDAVRLATAARTERRSWRASGTTRPSRTRPIGVGTFHRPLLKAAAHHQYIVPNMCSNPSISPFSFPHAYNATPCKWLKLFNRSTYSLAGHGCTLEWMLQTLFISQSITLTACKVKTEGANRRHQLTAAPMTVIKESLTLQALGMHTLYPGANELSVRQYSLG